METLQRLYDSEINFSINTFWDAGFEWKLGDKINGFMAEGCNDDTLCGAIDELKAAAIAYYPDSKFAKLYK